MQLTQQQIDGILNVIIIPPRDIPLALDRAASQANAERLKILLALGWDPNVGPKSMRPLLYQAGLSHCAEHHNPELAKQAMEAFWVLLCSGADPGARDEDGRTFVQFAKMRKRVDRGFSLCPTYLAMLRRHRLRRWCPPLYKLACRRPVRYWPCTYSGPLDVLLPHFSPQAFYAELLASLKLLTEKTEDPLYLLQQYSRHRSEFARLWKLNDVAGRIQVLADVHRLVRERSITHAAS